MGTEPGLWPSSAFEHGVANIPPSGVEVFFQDLDIQVYAFAPEKTLRLGGRNICLACKGRIVETLPDSRQILWQDIIQKIQVEWQALGEKDRSWITVKIERLTDLQQQIHFLVSVADGEDACRDCAGACCEHGLYHPTLVTVLAHFVLRRPLPIPDFHQSCPYFGEAGCSFSPAVRPYNCLIFICEIIEDRLSAEQRQALSSLELELRGIYEAFDHRYAGSSLRGLMNREPGDMLHSLLERQNVLD